VVPATIPKADDNTRQHVVVSVSGHLYQLDAGTFTSWQVRRLAASIAARTGESYDQVIADVIGAYIDALDGLSTEAAA
jgi:hypothetical protein